MSINISLTNQTNCIWLILLDHEIYAAMDH